MVVVKLSYHISFTLRFVEGLDRVIETFGVLSLLRGRPSDGSLHRIFIAEVINWRLIRRTVQEDDHLYFASGSNDENDGLFG